MYSFHSPKISVRDVLGDEVTAKISNAFRSSISKQDVKVSLTKQEKVVPAKDTKDVEVSKPQGPQVDNFPKVLFLAVVFLIIFSAYNPVQNMVSMLFKQLGEAYLGIFAMVVVNQTYGIASFIVPVVGPKLSHRKVFIVCSGCFVLFIYIGKIISSCADDKSSFICQSYVIYSMMIAASIFTGFGLAFIWFTCSVYLQACCNENNKGRIFGVFGAIHQSSNLTGAFLTLILLKWFGVGGFFFVQALVGVVAAILFTRVTAPLKSEQSSQEAPKSDPANFNKLIHFMTLEKMKAYYPLIMLSSYSFGYLVSNLAKMTSRTVDYLPADEANVRVSYVMVWFGICELIGSLVTGTIFDKSRELAVKVIMGFSFLVAFLNFVGFQWSWYFMYFPISLCFGFLDSGMQSVLGALLASRFPDKSEQFAIFRFVQGMYQAFFFLVVLLLEQISPYLMFIVQLLMTFYAWSYRSKY